MEPRPAVRRLARHDLVWLRPEAAGAVAATAPASFADEVARWIARGRPLVVRRRDAAPGCGPTHAEPAASDDALAVALKLPPARGGAPVALLAPAAELRRVAPPLPLADALDAAPAPWRRALEPLVAGARAAALDVRVYGSLAWQRLTGERYVGDRSDVDLLVAAATRADVRCALDLLRPWAAHARPRLDGELVLASSVAIAWRELAALPERVLVKSTAGVALAPLATILGALAEGDR